jgi:SAM-dependent methyltransferase
MKNVEAHEIEQRLLWDREYGELKIIPSSLRESPSKPFLLYEGLLDFARLTPVLDAGCGNGRNAIYLAKKGCEVYAVDFSDIALAYVRQRTQSAELLDKIHIRNLPLGGRWQLPDDYFGLTLDSYVFCHVIDREQQENYRQQLRRVMRPSGILYSSVFCVDDAYYREVAKSSAAQSRVVTDPRNNIQKYLYTEDEFQSFFSKDLRIRYFAKFQFDDNVLGRTFRRSILTLILEK